MSTKRKRRGALASQIEKHYRWFRRYWYKTYMQRVRVIEKDLGGQLHAC